MRFPTPLIAATLKRRYKRFLADMELSDGEIVTAHCANPGSMMGLAEPGMRCWLSHAQNPKRKLAYNWELVEADKTLVGIHTGHPNGLVAEAIAEGTVVPLQGYAEQRREVKYGENSRVDLLLRDPGAADCYVEVKNVHLLRQPGLAEFPDSKTARGAKHLAELAQCVAQGHRAVMFYVVQRGDCDTVGIAQDIDPNYAQAMKIAQDAGVEILAYSCDINIHGIRLARPLSVRAL